MVHHQLAKGASSWPLLNLKYPRFVGAKAHDIDLALGPELVRFAHLLIEGFIVGNGSTGGSEPLTNVNVVVKLEEITLMLQEPRAPQLGLDLDEPGKAPLELLAEWHRLDSGRQTRIAPYSMEIAGRERKLEERRPPAKMHRRVAGRDPEAAQVSDCELLFLGDEELVWPRGKHHSGTMRTPTETPNGPITSDTR